ncbi:MAG: histidinol dehydrogenase [Saprospiraceae bacterium]|nr:histidinol dehydrogenase [Saprospiraceae bacterium]
MKIYNHPSPNTWSDLLRRPMMSTQHLEQVVGEIIDAVKTKGDEALRALTLQFDKVALDNLAVEKEEIAIAIAQVAPNLKHAIQTAYQNISTFHQKQQTAIEVIETMPGVQCWRKSVAIEKVGLYVPGGTAPLFSTILMLGVPAKIAGCQEIILCTPPQKDGTIHPAMLFTAHLVGIHRIFKVGGAQA